MCNHYNGFLKEKIWRGISVKLFILEIAEFEFSHRWIILAIANSISAMAELF